MSRRAFLSALREIPAAYWPLALLLALVAFVAWPRTKWKRRKGPKLMSQKRPSLGEQYGQPDDPFTGRDAAA